MMTSEHHRVSAVQAKGDPSLWAVAFALHFDGAEGRRFHIDLKLLDRRDQHVTTVRFAPQHERIDAPSPGAGWASPMVPGAARATWHFESPQRPDSTGLQGGAAVHRSFFEDR
jgi:hypothetical protein